MKKEHKKHQGLTFFYITIIVTLIAMGSSVFYTFNSFYKIAKDDAISIGEKAIYETSEHLNNFLINGLDVITVVSQAAEYMMKVSDNPVDDIKKYLTFETGIYRDEINKDFTGIYGFLKGTYIDGTDWIPDGDYDPESRDWYKSAIGTLGSPTIVPPYIDAQTGKIIISVAKMLSDWSVLALDIQLDELQEFVENLKGSHKSDSNKKYEYSFIIDKTGLIVAHTDKSQIGRNLVDEKRTSRYASKLSQSIFTRGPTSTKTDSLELENEKCFIFSQQVQNDWFVVDVISESNLFQKVKVNLWRNIFLSILILVIVAYFCAISLLNRIKSNKLANLLSEHQKSLKRTISEQTSKIINQTKELVDFQQSTIEGIAQLIESRDGSTGEHVKNSKRYVLILTNYLYENGLYQDEVDEDFVDIIGNAATLHDVGKIHISDAILNKHGSFTEDEYEEMKKHSVYGGEVVRTIFRNSKDQRLVKITYDTVRHHHEKWNGMGYPDRLSGEDIPLCARIMTIADVYDALVSKRVYKEAFPKEQIFRMMTDERGKTFDPRLLDIFLDLMK